MIKFNRSLYLISYFSLVASILAWVQVAQAAEQRGGSSVELERSPVVVAQLTLDRIIRLAPQTPPVGETAVKPVDAASAGVDVPADGVAQPAAEMKQVVLNFKKNQRADLVFRDFLKANKMGLDWRYPFYVILDEEASFEGTSVREVVTKALAALGLRATLDGGRTVIVDQRF